MAVQAGPDWCPRIVVDSQDSAVTGPVDRSLLWCAYRDRDRDRETLHRWINVSSGLIVEVVTGAAGWLTPVAVLAITMPVVASIRKVSSPQTYHLTPHQVLLFSLLSWRNQTQGLHGMRPGRVSLASQTSQVSDSQGGLTASPEQLQHIKEEPEISLVNNTSWLRNLN